MKRTITLNNQEAYLEIGERRVELPRPYDVTRSVGASDTGQTMLKIGTMTTRDSARSAEHSRALQAALDRFFCTEDMSGVDFKPDVGIAGDIVESFTRIILDGKKYAFHQVD